MATNTQRQKNRRKRKEGLIERRVKRVRDSVKRKEMKTGREVKRPWEHGLKFISVYYLPEEVTSQQ